MRKLVYIGFFLLTSIGSLASAQYADQDNRFNQSQEHNSNQKEVSPSTQEETIDKGAQNRGPSNPGDIPIDDYIPLLMLAGIGLVLYINKNKKIKIN